MTDRMMEPDKAWRPGLDATTEDRHNRCSKRARCRRDDSHFQREFPRHVFRIITRIQAVVKIFFGTVIPNYGLCGGGR